VPPTLPRRRLLGVIAGWIGLCTTPLATSCTTGDAQEPAQPKADPDGAVRDRVAASVQALIVAYDATAGRHPALASELAPLRAEHAAHLEALDRAATPSGAPAGSPTTRPKVAADSRTARSALVRAEERAAASRVREAVAAASPDLARLLAAIGASEAAHAALLREVRRGR
jgi:hypothetical protein